MLLYTYKTYFNHGKKNNIKFKKHRQTLPFIFHLCLKRKYRIKNLHGHNQEILVQIKMRQHEKQIY